MAGESRSSLPPVGILSLQGDFSTHERALSSSGLATRAVTRPPHLEGLGGLVLPGGESSTMWWQIRLENLGPLLIDRLEGGLPVLATCAGLILLAKEIRPSGQGSLALLDLVVERNGYGRQVHSGVRRIDGAGGFPDCEGVFIRAPLILECGPSVEVLGTLEGRPVLVRRANLLAACFHPELSDEHPILELFHRTIATSHKVASA